VEQARHDVPHAAASGKGGEEFRSRHQSRQAGGRRLQQSRLCRADEEEVRQGNQVLYESGGPEAQRRSVPYNIGSSYFSDHQYAKAAQAYKAAFALDPDIFIRVSRTGIMAQSASPEDRAAFSFMVAKMYAKAGDVDRSIEYLRKAMENGYKKINEVYTDQEFATMRTDKRFEELMAQKPQAIQ
jgi:tetratricopeptide (TPR) repeat protein